MTYDVIALTPNIMCVVAEKKADEAKQGSDFPPAEASSGFLPQTAEAATGAPSLTGPYAGLTYTPAPENFLAPKMAPAPAPMFAPAPAPEQILSKYLLPLFIFL